MWSGSQERTRDACFCCSRGGHPPLGGDLGMVQGVCPVREWEEHGLCFLQDGCHLEPLITFKVGPQEEVLEFIVHTDVPGGCDVGGDTVEMAG